MNTNKYGIINKALSKEQYHWLEEDIPAGTEVQKYIGCTYGCIGYTGVAVIMKNDEGIFDLPFTEVPGDSVDWRNPECCQ